MNWVPTIISLVGTAAALYHVPIQNWMSQHPAISVAVAGGWAILNHFLPPPAGPGAEPKS